MTESRKSESLHLALFYQCKECGPVAARPECSQTEEFGWHITSEIVDFH
jgi:hypothetical protein